MWSYLTYDHSLRLILYGRKAKVVIEREKREAETHWGKEEENPDTADSAQPDNQKN